MNTIEEILNFKNQKCSNCKNKNNKEDLCNITKTLNNSFKCVNYEICMKNKCKTCKFDKLCQLNIIHNKG